MKPLTVTWMSRVAVTLGLGAAVAAGTGVAHADQGTGSAASKNTTTGSTKANGSTRGVATRVSTGHPRPRHANAAGPTTGVVVSTGGPHRRPVESSTAAPGAEPAAPSADHVVRAAVSTASEAPTGEAGPGPRQAGARTARLSSLTGPVVRAVTPATAAQIPDMAGVVGGMLAWVSLGDRPIAPIVPPTVWAVLAWVRREIQHTFFNHSPTLAYDPATTGAGADGVTTGSVQGADPDGDALAYSVSTPANGGNATIDDQGNFTYTPTTDLAATGGTDTFTVTVTDDTGTWHLHGLGGYLFEPDHGHTATTTVAITVTVDTPDAVADTYTVVENGTLNPDATTGVLANDTDPGGLTLAVDTITQPTHGHITMDTDGSFEYRPDTDYTGTDTFTYTASNTLDNTSTATVTITVMSTAT